MITKSQKNVIIKTIGKKHISKIQEFALDQGREKDGGGQFSHSTFSHVLNGRLDHTEVEQIILDAADHYSRLKKQEKARRKNIVERLKKSA